LAAAGGGPGRKKNQKAYSRLDKERKNGARYKRGKSGKNLAIHSPRDFYPKKGYSGNRRKWKKAERKMSGSIMSRHFKAVGSHLNHLREGGSTKQEVIERVPK